MIINKNEPGRPLATDKPQFRLDIEWFRGVAILFIVLGHMHSHILPSYYYFAIQNGSVFFLFLSGFLFHYLYDPNLGTPKFYYKKFCRLVLPYLVATVPGFCLLYVAQGKPFDLGFFFLSLAVGTGHNNDAHWFIPALIIIYLTYPLLRLLSKRPRLLLWSCLIGLLVGSLTFRPWANTNPFMNAGHFYGVFLLGMLASTHYLKIETWLTTRFWWVVGVGGALFVATLPMIPDIFFLSMEDVIRRGRLTVDWTMVSKLCLIPVIMAILIKLSRHNYKLAVLSLLARLSFGIFLFHGYVILFINSNFMTQLIPHNRFSIFVLQTIFVLAIVSGFLLAMRRLFPRQSQFLFGY